MNAKQFKTRKFYDLEVDFFEDHENDNVEQTNETNFKGIKRPASSDEDEMQKVEETNFKGIKRPASSDEYELQKVEEKKTKPRVFAIVSEIINRTPKISKRPILPSPVPKTKNNIFFSNYDDDNDDNDDEDNETDAESLINDESIKDQKINQDIEKYLLDKVQVEVDLNLKLTKSCSKVNRTQEKIDNIWSIKIPEGDEDLMTQIDQNYKSYIDQTRRMFKNSVIVWDCSIHPDHYWRHFIQIVNFSTTLSLVQLQKYILPQYTNEELIQFILWINSHSVSPIETNPDEIQRNNDPDMEFELNYLPEENVELSQQAHYILKYYYNKSTVVAQISRQLRFCTWWYCLFLERKTLDHGADPLIKFNRVMSGVLYLVDNSRDEKPTWLKKSNLIKSNTNVNNLKELPKILGCVMSPKLLSKNLMKNVQSSKFHRTNEHYVSVFTNYLDVVNKFFWCSQAKRHFYNGIYVSNAINLNRIFAQMGINRKKVDVVLNEVRGSKSAIVNKFVAWKRNSVFDENLQNVMLDIFERNQPCLDTDFARENASSLDNRLFSTFPRELDILSGFIVESMIPFVKQLYVNLIPSTLLYNPLAESNHSLVLNKTNTIDESQEPIFQYVEAIENEILSYDRVYIPSKITFTDFDMMCKKLKREQCLKILDHPLILQTCNVILSLAVQYGQTFLTNFFVYYFGEKRVGKGNRARYLQELFFSEFSPVNESENLEKNNTNLSSSSASSYSDQNTAVLSYLLAQMSSTGEIEENEDEQQTVESEEPIELTLLEDYSEYLLSADNRQQQSIEMRRYTFLKFIRAEGNLVSVTNLDRQTLIFLVRNILLLLRNSSNEDTMILDDVGSVLALRRARLSVLRTLREKEVFQPGIVFQSQDLTNTFIKFILSKCKEILGLCPSNSLYPLSPILIEEPERVWNEIEEDLKSVAAAAIFLYPYCFENSEVLEFLLKYLKGHEIPGQWHKKVLLLYGNSDSGKTFFLNLLRNVFKTGDNYVISCGSLAKASSDLNQIIHPFAENLMLISEEPKTMDVSTLKQMISEGPIGSRQMFSDNYISKFASAKLWCSSNSVPIIYNCDQGADTRFLVLHFKHKFLQLGKFGQVSIDGVAPPEIALQITRQRFIRGVDDCAIIKGFYLLLRTYLSNLTTVEDSGIITMLIPKMMEQETTRILRQMDHYLQFKNDIEIIEDSTHVTTTSKLRGIIKVWLKNNNFTSNNLTATINTFLNRFREQYSHLLIGDGNENYHCLIEMCGKKM